MSGLKPGNPLVAAVKPCDCRSTSTPFRLNVLSHAGGFAGLDLERLLPPFQAGCEVQGRGQQRQHDGVRQVQVHEFFLLDVGARIEGKIARIVRSQRRVDRIADEERDVAHPDPGAEFRCEAERLFRRARRRPASNPVLVPPKRGVKPPGNSSFMTKQSGWASLNLCASKAPSR